MRGEWCYFKNYLSVPQCEYIVSVIRARPAEEATLGVEGKISDTQIRRSKIRWVKPGDPQLDFLFDTIWKLALPANEEWFGFHLSKIPYIQIAEYDSVNQSEYKKHHDVFYTNSVMHRKLSVVIQLTDPSQYKGCDLEFYETDSVPVPKDIRSQGTATFFPSFIRHAATPITTGIRYSIAAWVEGPHFV